ncbi:hypothetical protein Tco_1021630, partial [Tanacetum coccineum]
MKKLSLTSYTPYPSRKIRCICACTPLKTTKEQDSIRRIQRNPIRRIQVMECEYSGRYRTWSLLQEIPNTPLKWTTPTLAMEEYIRLEEEKARRHGMVCNWETATYGKIWDNEDVHDLGSVETEFPAIVFNDTLTCEAPLSYEPTVSSLNNDGIDFRISFDESDDEDYT